MKLRHSLHRMHDSPKPHDEDDILVPSIAGMSKHCGTCRRFRLQETNAEFYKTSSTFDDMDNFARLSALRKQAASGCGTCATLAEAVEAVMCSDGIRRACRKRSMGITRR